MGFTVITEEARHRLYQALEQELGHEEATTLMEHLPPVGWADVATKRDLELVETKFEAALHREISSLKSSFMWTLLASNATFASFVIAAAKLLG